MVLECCGIVMDVPSHAVYVNGSQVRLAKTEFEMLKVLLMHSNEIVSRWALINYVWGLDPCADGTFKTHMHRLRKAIGKEKIACVIGQGYTIKDRRTISLADSMES